MDVAVRLGTGTKTKPTVDAADTLGCVGSSLCIFGACPHSCRFVRFVVLFNRCHRFQPTCLSSYNPGMHDRQQWMVSNPIRDVLLCTFIGSTVCGLLAHSADDG